MISEANLKLISQPRPNIKTPSDNQINKSNRPYVGVIEVPYIEDEPYKAKITRNAHEAILKTPPPPPKKDANFVRNSIFSIGILASGFLAFLKIKKH